MLGVEQISVVICKAGRRLKNSPTVQLSREFLFIFSANILNGLLEKFSQGFVRIHRQML